MTGINRYDDKDRRKQRRRNHIAKDLRNTEFHMRRVESKKDTGEKYKYWERYVIDEE